MSTAARLLLVLAALTVGCASTRKDGPPALPYELEGNDNVGTRSLNFAARREMASFEEHGRREADLADAAYSMELECRRRGYAHAAVTFRLEPSAEAPERAVFVIDEGPLARIGKVEFIGAIAFDHKQLMKFFPTGDKPVFLQSQVDGAVGEIERTYLLAGYREVRAGPVEITWSEDKANADVRIPIIEGPRFVIESYDVEGKLDPGLDARFLAPLRGEGFYARLPSEAAAQLRAVLMNRGHQKATVEVKTTIEETRVHLAFRVVEGPVYTVREITISGRDRTRRRFIRSRIPLEEGDTADESEIAEGVDALYRTGVFRSVEVKKSYPSDVETDIDYALEELDARSVSFQVGWGSYELLRGGVRYQDRNFLGFGRRFEVEAGASTKGYNLGASISDNYLLGPRNTLRFAAGVFLREEPSFTRSGYNFTLSITHKLNDQWKITVGYLLDTQDATDVKTDAPDLTEGEFLTSAGLFTTLAYDSRDSKLVPAKGTRAEVGVFWSSPTLGADLNYLGLRGSWFTFFKIGENIVIGTGVRFESRPLLDNSTDLPIQKRLFLGGATTIRSFRQSRLGPFEESTNEPTGGLTAASAHVESRMRLWRELHWALFYELGMVSEQSLTIQEPYGQAIGTGLRYYLPVGPIRLDVAYNPGETFSNSGRWEFHFAFGFSF